MKWTAEQLDTLHSLYANYSTEDVATVLGRDARSVYQKANSLGLKKSAKYLASPAAGRWDGKRGGATRFHKGQAAWNKGVKGVVGVQEACRATQFKRGRPAHEARNYVAIGSLRITKDGYLERKMTDDPAMAPARRWVAVHRLVWIEAHGAVPAGHVVVFKQGMKTTEPEEITLDKVECISLAENMKRNTLHRYPKEVATLIQLRGVLNRQINKGIRNGEND
jgi:hypothetical protein